MAVDVRTDREKDILAAIRPDAIVITIDQTLLEESGHIALRRRIALVIQADGLALVLAVHARLARRPQIGGAADGRVALDLALEGHGVAVDEGDVAVGGSRGGEVALELGVAAARVLFRANEHGAAGVVVGREAHFATRGAPGAAAAPGVSVGVGHAASSQVKLMHCSETLASSISACEEPLRAGLMTGALSPECWGRAKVEVPAIARRDR
ncbi:hypothetical protein MMC28_006062 [Mycoblastus sanguinarius]|nr:hypothetical protein [Mycoblastus sanguinarius]